MRLTHLVRRARRHLLLGSMSRLKGRVRVRRSSVRIGVLGCGIIRSPAEEFCAVGLVLCIFAGLFQRVHLRSKVGEIFAEPLYSFESFLLLLGNNFLAGETLVFVESLGERSDRGRYVANLGGRCLGFGVEVGELCTERLALPQGGIVGDVLNSIISKCINEAADFVHLPWREI